MPTQNEKLLCWRLPGWYLHVTPEADAQTVPARALRPEQEAGWYGPRHGVQAESMHMQAFWTLMRPRLGVLKEG